MDHAVCALCDLQGGSREEGPPEGPAAREGRPHPVPFRTRKLSAPSPIVLRCSPWEGRTQLGLPGASVFSGGASAGAFSWARNVYRVRSVAFCVTDRTRYLF